MLYCVIYYAGYSFKISRKSDIVNFEGNLRERFFPGEFPVYLSL